MSETDERLVLVDASVFITLVEIGAVELLYRLRGRVIVPDAVRREISDEPAATALTEAIDRDRIGTVVVSSCDREHEGESVVREAVQHLGMDESDAIEARESQPVSRIRSGDVALLAAARIADEAVVVTDDKPLRGTCKALSIPVSGSIGVLIRAVERGDLEPEAAKETLYAMDEVGARLSASLVSRAERLIDRADE